MKRRPRAVTAARQRVLEENPGAGSKSIQAVSLRVAGTTVCGPGQAAVRQEPRNELKQREHVPRPPPSPTLAEELRLPRPPHSTGVKVTSAVPRAGWSPVEGAQHS